MKRALLLIFLSTGLQAGEITLGSVPGTVNYQGRIERDNAPITGIVHLKFRFYNDPTAGTLRWESPEIVANAKGGIFSASFSPDYTKFASGERLYLEVQVESERLSPREPVNSVIYAMIAKKLEDGANLSVSTLVVTDLMAINAQPSSTDKLVVNGNIKLAGTGMLYFPDGSSMSSAGVGSAAGGISSPTDATVVADTDGNSSGDIYFLTGVNERMRILNNGNVGINKTNPTSLLDVNGNTNISGNLILGGILNNGIVNGANSENIQLGVTNDVIAFNSGGSERMRIHSNGNIGIHTNSPTQPLEVNGNIYSNAGLRASNVLVGNYSGQNANEISSNSGSLLLQVTSPGFVGIGKASPSEKLHVYGNIKSDYGVNASTLNITGDSIFSGNINANAYGKQVVLSSTTIYGRLQVYGPVSSALGDPAYLSSTQTFTGLNTFTNELFVATSSIFSGKVGVGISDFNFSGDKYLQVGDSNIGYGDSNLYMVSGSASNSRINFYRGESKASSIETAGDQTLAFYTNNQKAYIDANNFKIYNSALIVSPNANDSAPSIYVNSSNNNVGIGTTLTPHTLTVAGNIKLSGAGTAIIFDNGSTLSDSNLGSASSLSNPVDALVWADSDGNASGRVILKAGPNTGLSVNSNGDVGVGTIDPNAKLNLIGGDMMLGSTYNPYTTNGKEDLIVAGNVVVDGAIEQRSATPVLLSALTVSGNVYLSTATGAHTGIGTINPGASYMLDVNGNTNTSGYLNANAIYTGSTQRISSTGILSNTTWNGNTISVSYGGTGATSFTSGGILYGSGTGAIQALPVMTNGQLLIGDASGAPSVNTLTGTANQVNVSNGAGTITLSLPQDIATGSSPTFAGLTLSSLTGVLKANGSSSLTTMTGTANRLTKWSDSNTIAPSSILTDDGSSLSVSGPINAGNISASNVNATGAIGATSLTASSATLTATGSAQYSISASSGISINSGRIFINSGGLIDLNNSGRLINMNDPVNNQDAATKNYVDSQVLGGVSSAWSLSGNNIGSFDYLGSDNDRDVVIKRNNTTVLTVGNANLDVAGSITLTGTVDGVDISVYSPYFIGSAGTSDQVWKSDGSGAGVWGTDNTDDTVSGSELDGVFSTTGLLKRTGSANYSTITDNSANWDTAYTGVSNATDANTANTIVKRDASGNFSAGTITANLSGNATTATNVSGGTVSSATIRLLPKTISQLLAIIPQAEGEIYYCSDCSPKKIVVSTGTAAGNFADALGGTFK